MITLLVSLTFYVTSTQAATNPVTPVALVTSVTSVTLEQAYQAALARNEDVANQVELVNQAEERYQQAVGSVLPTINFLGTYQKQDSGSASSSIYPTNQQTNRITATQPLFQGFREYAGLKQTSRLSEVASFNRDQALIQIYQDLVTAFFNVLAADKDYQDLITEIGVNQKRLKDIQEFRRIGRSRDSDVLTIQANIAVLEAQVESAKTTIQNSRAIFSFITGLPATVQLDDSMVSTAVSTAVSTMKIEDKKKFMDQINVRPDVNAALRSVDAADSGVTIARGGHLPSLNLGGNYYFDRPGVLQNVKWDATLSLVFPIFQGGVINSEVRVAASQLKQADLALSKARRAAEEQVQTFWELATGDLKLIDKQTNAVDLSQKNYEAEQKDYKFGLVNNLEVLQALTTAQESARALDRTRYQYKADYLKLQSSIQPKPPLAKGVL